MTFTATALLLSWIAIVTLGFALAGVLQRVHRLEQRLAPGGSATTGPEAASLVGAQAPEVDGLSIDPDRGAVLLFADRECRTCLQVLPAATAAAAAGDVPVHVLWSGPAGPVGDTGVRHHPDAGAAYEAFAVVAAPWLVVIGPGRRIVGAGAAGSEARSTDLLSMLPTLEEVED